MLADVDGGGLCSIAPPYSDCQVVWEAMSCGITHHPVPHRMCAHGVDDAHHIPEVISYYCVLINYALSIDGPFVFSPPLSPYAEVTAFQVVHTESGCEGVPILLETMR